MSTAQAALAAQAARAAQAALTAQAAQAAQAALAAKVAKWQRKNNNRALTPATIAHYAEAEAQILKALAKGSKPEVKQAMAFYKKTMELVDLVRALRAPKQMHVTR